MISYQGSQVATDADYAEWAMRVVGESNSAADDDVARSIGKTLAEGVIRELDSCRLESAQRWIAIVTMHDVLRREILTREDV
jgi:hypothetical protein